MRPLYRALLRCYPASFRADYGAEMRADFDARLAAAPGFFPGLWLLLEAVADIVPNAIAVHAGILAQDVRYTGRTLSHARGFAATAILVAALGVGANTAAFSVADYVLVRPLPMPRPDRLAVLWERTPGYPTMEFSPANLRDVKALSASYSGIGAYSRSAANLSGVGEPQRLQTTMVDGDVFPVLGVRPLLGRVFARGDGIGADRGDVVLSYGLWQSQFGGDPRVLGARIDLDGAPSTVIGVMPRAFHFPNRDVQLWQPMILQEGHYADRNDNWLAAIGRLRDGVTIERANADLTYAMRQLEIAHPHDNEHTGAFTYLLKDDLSDRSRLLLLGLCGAALCVLMLACANLASLLLARAASRERELAVRAALGAGRERLVRQMLTESVLLAVAGGALGVLVAVGAVPVLARLVPTSLPIAEHPGLDLRVLALAGVFTALTGVGFGVMPALRTGGRNGFDALRDGTRAGGGRRQRLRATLVAVEVAASVVLLVSSGLLVRAMWRLEAVDPGFRTSGILTMRTALPMPRYDITARRDAYYDRVLAGVRALPGVQSAAFASALPVAWGGGIWPVVLSGQEVLREASNSASLRYISPQFFASLDIPLRRGRDFDERDTRDGPWVAVVSESFVRRYWPGQDPIGKHFQFGLADRTVVGVAADIRMRGLEQPSEPQVWLPYRQAADSQLVFYAPKDLVVRAAGDPMARLPAVRAIIRAADPQQPLTDVRTMDQVVAGETASRRAQLQVLGALAVVALLLAGIGIHGLLAYTVSQRSQEIGVRMALGATPGGIARLVVRDGVALAVAGIVPGLAAAWAAGMAMRALLLGVTPGDPITIAIVVAVSLAMALIGSLVPAVRAVRVSPMSAMRAE